MSSLKKAGASEKLSRECLFWSGDCASPGSRYVSLSKIRRMASSRSIDVDVATVCSRLQVLRAAGSDKLVDLRKELESELYPSPGTPVGAVRGRLKGRRLGMTAGEAIKLFETVGVLSPLVFKIRVSERLGAPVSKLEMKQKRQKRAIY